jgi:hypothetical protein
LNRLTSKPFARAAAFRTWGSSVSVSGREPLTSLKTNKRRQLAVVAHQDKDVSKAERAKTSRQSELGRFVDDAVVESAFGEERSAQSNQITSEGL